MKNRIKAMRVNRGWTQTEFAEMIRVSRQSVHAIESGKSEPSLTLAFRMAQIFDTAIDEIFEGPHEMPRRRSY